MKKVNKNFDDVPTILQRDQLRCEAKLLEDGKPNQSCWSRVKVSLEHLYDFKCAYCEIDLRKFNRDSTVEHYRPKSKNQYYWLAHEWSNFLLACSDCQRFKDNDFPIGGEQQLIAPILENGRLDYEKCKSNHSYLLSELPLILNPEIDDPAEYFSFNIENGKFEAIGENVRALKTLDLLRLNRDNLCFQRKKIVDELFVEFERCYKLLLNNKVENPTELTFTIIKASVEEKSSTISEFSFVRKYINENFDIILEGN